MQTEFRRAARLAALSLATLAWAALAWAAQAQDRAGDFDHYVLALSWNASWCAAEGDARAAPQCDPRRDHGFVLHGLWPQHEQGWPEWSRSPARDPGRAETAAMADIMGSGGLAWHAWKKHGRCSGLTARAYFEASRRAFAQVTRPAALRALRDDVEIAPEVIEAAFLEANPGLTADGVTVTCAGGLFREVRICLTRDLAPRACARDAARDCATPLVALPPMR